MPAPRSRHISGLPYVGHVIDLSTGISYDHSVNTLGAGIEDTIGNFPAPNPLWISRWGLDPVLVDGQALAFPTYRFVACPTDNQGVTPSHLVYGNDDPHCDLSFVVSAVTDVAARTNPSRADVSVPNFVYELKDIPEMLHQKGQAWAKKRPSNSAVAHNFGWQLLFQDVARMIDFTSSVNNRVKELNRLHSKGGLKRRRTVFRQSFTYVQENVTFQSVEVYLQGTVTGVTTDHRWVSMVWRPDSVNMPSAADLTQQARSIVHGWDFSSNGLAAKIWEAIPWSWFADYFGNLGSYFAAKQNGVGAQPVNACLMRHIETVYTMTVVGAVPGFTTHNGRLVFEDKVRQLGLVSLSASLTFLSPKQLTTLLSIAYNLKR